MCIPCTMDLIFSKCHGNIAIWLEYIKFVFRNKFHGLHQYRNISIDKCWKLRLLLKCKISRNSFPGIHSVKLLWVVFAIILNFVCQWFLFTTIQSMMTQFSPPPLALAFCVLLWTGGFQTLNLDSIFNTIKTVKPSNIMVNLEF